MINFTKQVYQIVKAIRPGRVMSYRQVAEAVGKPHSWRAVGRILSRNYDPRVPCHRVIRSDGRTGGYNRGIAAKKELLQKEGWRGSL